MSQVRWLHLSDFHVGKDNYGQRKLFKEINDLIGARIASGYDLDFVFLTGDLANRGAQTEYEEFFDSFFVPMIEALGGDKWEGKVFSIPGNHDVERERAKFFSPADILRAPDQVFDPTAIGRLQREQFTTRFTNYSSNEATNSPNKWINSDQGSYAQVINMRSHKIGVVGVNTAWLCKGDSDRHLLSPGTNLLEDALSRVAEADLKIVLGHHPLSWLHDYDARTMQTILAKNHAVYLHGHLHENDARIEDGGAGAFLAIQSGAAFQGRAEDKAKWVNGLVWAELDFEQNAIRLQPNHWNAQHREWKVSSDAFPNARNAGDDWWQFPIPGKVSLSLASATTTDKPKPAIDEVGGDIAVRNGWSVVDKSFLTARSADQTTDVLLQYFDGRPPNWRTATSLSVPRRRIVEQLFARLNSVEDAAKPTILNLIGAGGEGKSTAFFQVAARLVNESNWTCLWRSNDTQSIDIATIERMSKQFDRVMVAIDEAHSAAEWLSILLLRMKRLPKCNVHFLLCSRSIDWRSEASAFMGAITRDSDYQEISLRGLTHEDAEMIVDAWGKLGKAGLKNLSGMDATAAAATLQASADNQEVEDDEGAFLGAMLKCRYGNSLKDKIRSIIYRLKDIEIPGGSLLDAYAMIAIMHSEGLRFLSLNVLAEALDCSFSDARRRIINPLADEAVAAGGGRFVLCRHKEIAKATVEVLKETNLFGEMDDVFATLSRAAVTARGKGGYVPDLHKWDYTLPEHFAQSDRTTIALAASEAMLDADPLDIKLRVNLSKLYRGANHPERAVVLFRELERSVEGRIAWHEWAVAERDCGNILVSIVLAAISLCDLPETLVPTRESGARTLGTIAGNFLMLHERYGDPNYIQSTLVTTQLAQKLCAHNVALLETVSLRHERALALGGTLHDESNLIPIFSAVIPGVASLIDCDAVLKNRVPRTALGLYTGVASLLR